MDRSIVYTKTAKGVIELKNGGKGLGSALYATLKRVDGRSSVADLCAGLSSEMQEMEEQALNELEKRQLIRAFARRQAAHEAVSAARGADHVADSSTIPLLQIEELSPEEGVRAWAEARRGAKELVQNGFYAAVQGTSDDAVNHERRALIVEDDPAISLLMKSFLSKRGFTVKAVADGQEALTVLDQVPAPHIVLLDVNLPNINGFDILAYLREHKDLKAVPAIMVTAQVSDADVLRGLKGGADGYIFKPFEWAAFYQCVKRVLGIVE